MAQFNFKGQFADQVRDGRKKQTIRAKRKRPPRVGEIAYLFTGLRTKQCQRLGAKLIISVEEIQITERHIGITHERESSDITHILGPRETANLIIADGFDTAEDFFTFFREQHGFPFFGHLTKWE